MTPGTILKANSLFKRYREHVVLDDVSLALKPGSITTIIGPSGGGKSTLLRAISMIDPPNSGSVTINENTYKFPNPTNNLTHNSPWPKITLVFQQLFLWPHLTLFENILLPIHKLEKKKSMELVDPLVNEFGMKNFIDRYPNQVSFGQKQLAAIIRALVLKPDFLLLDEITSALDIEYVNLILNKLRNICREGVGILLVTHYIGFAKKSADQVLFIDKGKILEMGSPEILIKPKSERMKKFISLVNTINDFVE